ncbi:MAG: D-alanine--D-alanine ligase family protein [Candidatus Limnocylindrales bacterium]|jgi:D-alanine-D-alanine ligase
MSNPTVAVIFGGRSVEHEVSVISGHQAMDALDQAGFPVLPIYITKQGDWYAGDGLDNLDLYREQTFHAAGLKNVFRVSLSPDRSVRQLIVHPGAAGGLLSKSPKLWADVFFPMIHGSHGEDGSLQGLFELADVPYVGSGILASSLGIDKVLTKRVLRQAGIPTLDCVVVSRPDWEKDPDAFIGVVEARHRYPAMVKPVSLGSSIGVSSCADRASLRDALDLALELDGRALVEDALTDFIEINCSVLGPPERASACEQPVRSESVLSFDDKYKHGGKKLGRGAASSTGMAGLQRQVPAPIGEALTSEVQRLAIEAFRAIDASGVVRVDFLYDRSKAQLLLNEINTTPGSLAYYLWEEEGLRFDQLVARLIAIALERHENRRATVYSFSANLLTR